MPVKFERWRCYVLGRRLHHGLTGVILVVTGVALAVHDWADRRVWLRYNPRYKR